MDDDLTQMREAPAARQTRRGPRSTRAAGRRHAARVELESPIPPTRTQP